MNRPVIKGTANHKASIAKAKAQSVVSQSRTKADASLVGAADALGKSYKPQAIDFELDKINIDVPEKKEKKKLTPEEQAAKDARKQERKAKRKKFGKNLLDVGGKIVEGVSTLVGGALLVPVAIGNGLFKLGENIVDELGNVVEGAIEDIQTKGAEGKKKRAEKNAKIKAEKEAEKLRIQAEKDANYVGKGHIDDPETDYKNTKGYKDIKKKEEEAAKKAEFEAEQEANKPITLEPKSIRPLPTNKQKLELQKSTGTVATTEFTDRQMKKADKYMREQYGEDFDLDDPDIRKEYTELLENPNKQGTQLHYNDDKDEWVLAGAYTSPEDIQTDKNMQAASENYGVEKTDMQVGEDGTWVPKEGAKSNYGDTWGDMGDGTMGWLDDGKEKYYTPEGKRISKETSDKLVAQQEKKAEKALRTQNIAEAKAYYGDDVVTTQERFDAYVKMKNEGTLPESYEAQLEQEKEEQEDKEMEEMELMMEEQWAAEKAEEERIKAEKEEALLNQNLDKIEAGHGGGVTDLVQEETKTEPVVEETTTKPVVEQVTTTPDRKPKPSDFEGTWKEKQEQYKIANDKWYQAQQAKKGKSPMEMRDNRIYRNAVKGGTVQQNMIKSGYIPE